MRKVEQDAIYLLFGKAVTQYPKAHGYEAQDYESLATNGLEPFRTLKEALKASLTLEKVSDIESVWLGKIEIKILSQDELESPDIRQATNLIVIEFRDEDDVFLRGTLVESFSGAIPGSSLGQNGLRPFPSFERAYDAALQAHRQAACPVALATFNLEPIIPT